MGPTATGKTDLAMRLAEALPVDLISVDSAMVYRGLDIGSAKPDQVTLQQYPHRLIDILDPAEAYSAGQFCRDALAEMDEIISRGRIPLLVGGTMLYFNALQNGMAELPDADPEIRERLEAEAASQGWQALHQRLAGLDQVVVVGTDRHHGAAHLGRDLHQVAADVGVVGGLVAARLEVPPGDPAETDQQEDDEHDAQRAAAARPRGRPLAVFHSFLAPVIGIGVAVALLVAAAERAI